jgi:serine/threonine-protein kinase
MNSATLVTLLNTLGLWPEEEPLQRTVLELSGTLPDGKQLAGELIQRDLLTPYQANLLLTGKGQQLVVGPYRILQRLGEGGMGQVFKARNQKWHRVVALKVIRPERVTNPVAVERFRREVRAAGPLLHPNIVRGYDADQADGTYYFAMQYVPGTDLSKLVKQGGPLPIAQACNFIYQAAQGLQHIHDNRLVHRDIKPSNLMIGGPDPALPGQANVVRILDLGLARLMEDDETAPDSRRGALTQMGAVMGTADYMSPEQARDSRLVDARSDIYSLGCTLYFALCGRPPFPGGTALEKMLHHQLDEPDAVEQLRPEVPPTLAHVLRRMMAKQPEARYQQADAAAADLKPLFIDAAPMAIPVTDDEPEAPSLAHFAFDPDAPVTPRLGHGPQLLRPMTWGNWLWVAITGVAALTLLVIGLVVRALTR